MVGNKFKNLHHKLYEELLKRLQKTIQAIWKFWQTKAFSDQKENIKTDQKITEGQITDKIYHGCSARYSNSKRKINSNRLSFVNKEFNEKGTID